MIDAADITVRVRGRVLLDRVSLGLRAGTVTALLGPNGAGKTTLLRVVSGLLRPESGQVTLDGAALHAMPPAVLARRRAVLGQHQVLEFGLTAADVVALGRLPHAGTEGARADRAAVAACRAAFGLDPFWTRAYPSLSGGERQRVQLARVAAQLWPGDQRGGQALFLDEPTAALDVAQQATALDFTRRMAASGTAVLVILHDLNQAARADRVVLLRDGRVDASGPPAEVMRPATLERCFGVAVEAVRRADGGVGLLLA